MWEDKSRLQGVIQLKTGHQHVFASQANLFRLQSWWQRRIHAEEPIHPAPSYNVGISQNGTSTFGRRYFYPSRGRKGTQLMMLVLHLWRAKVVWRMQVWFRSHSTVRWSWLEGINSKFHHFWFKQKDRNSFISIYLCPFTHVWHSFRHLSSTFLWLGLGPAALLHRVHEGQIYSPYNLNILEMWWQQTSICSI